MGDDPVRHPCLVYMVHALGDFMGSYVNGLWVLQPCCPVYHGYLLSDMPEHSICSCLIKSRVTSSAFRS